VVIDHRPAYGPFTVDVTAANGPAPGAVTITTAGVDIDLSQTPEPGLVEIHNRSSDQLVTYGMYDTETNAFYPFGELAPGEGATLKFSQNFGERDDGPGTGTTSSAIVTLRMYSATGNAVVYIGAFAR
jgi:hypothetical protein